MNLNDSKWEVQKETSLSCFLDWKTCFQNTARLFISTGVKFLSAGYNALAHINLNINSSEEEKYGPVMAFLGDK